MKGKMFRLIFILAVLTAVLSIGVLGASPQAQTAADALHDLGLFNGVGVNADQSPNYDLDSPATRETAVTILVRLMGREGEAQARSYALPFSDISAWAEKTVGWAYMNGYTTGTTATTFSGTAAITAQQYLTLVLRVLGYSDKTGDFTYDTACSFAASIGLTDGSYTNQSPSFTRGDIAIISHNALEQTLNGGANTLYEACFPGTAVAHSAAADTSQRLASTAPATTPQAASTNAAGKPSPAQILENTAPGTKTHKSADGSVVIDYSNAKDGYVMVRTKATGAPKLVVMITGPDDNQYKYFYTNSDGTYQAFPLTAGKGDYQVGVYMNLSGTKYTTLLSATVSAAISGTAPFLRPNIFVDYTGASACVEEAAVLCGSCTDDLSKVGAVYDYVVEAFQYDYDLAATVTTGYRPVLDAVWTTKSGICFDYAATMTAMLRSQGIPTKLVVGYADTEYHAWISVYTPETGWVEAIIYFDGATWRYMDPTFASTGGAGATSFITDASNYQAKYTY